MGVIEILMGLAFFSKTCTETSIRNAEFTIFRNEKNVSVSFDGTCVSLPRDGAMATDGVNTLIVDETNGKFERIIFFSPDYEFSWSRERELKIIR